MELESGGLDGRVDRVEIFMQASRSHSSIMYSRSYTEKSDTFNDQILLGDPLSEDLNWDMSPLAYPQLPREAPWQN